MLNRILQILVLCVAVLLLTTGVAWSHPLSSGVLIAEHTPDHGATPIETTQPSAQTPPASQPTNTPDATAPDRAGEAATTQAIQANPAVPYDPYDINAIREMNRGIYGEKTEKS